MHFADAENVFCFFVFFQRGQSSNPNTPFYHTFFPSYLLGWNQAYSQLTKSTRLLTHQHGHLTVIEPKEEEYNYSLFLCSTECHSQFIKYRQYKLVPVPTGRVVFDDLGTSLSIFYTLKL